MSRFHLELTGYVGRDNFNSKQTVALLNQYPGKHVDVLIDSLGGSLAHGLSISDAFRTHGDVTAHLRGMCASAATIASMGAKKVTIAPEAFYLVHKVMMSFFDWSTHNADSLEKYIEALTKQKEDLQTLDASVAATYAARCKKPVNELLQLMKEGKWLTAQEALDWGFVDEITESVAAQPAKLTNVQASAFMAQGLPLPPIEFEHEPQNKSFFKELRSLFKSLYNMSQNQEPESKQVPQNSAESATDSQTPQNDELKALKDELEALKKEKDDLKAKYDELAKNPGDSTSNVVDTPPASPKNEEKDTYMDFMATSKSASELFNALP